MNLTHQIKRSLIESDRVFGDPVVLVALTFNLPRSFGTLDVRLRTVLEGLIRIETMSVFEDGGGLLN